MFLYPTPKPAVLAAITVLADAFGEYAFVSAKLPGHHRPVRFVKVSRAGGGLANIATDTARILVECFAKDIGQVEAMLNTARTALRSAGGTTVTSGDISMFVRGWHNENIVSEFPHPDILDYERGQLTGELHLKSN